MKDHNIIWLMTFLLFLEKISNIWMHFRTSKTWIIWFTIWTSITLTSSTSDTQLQVIMLMQSKSTMFHGLLSTMTCSHTLIFLHNIGLDILHQEQMTKDTQELDLLSCMHPSNCMLKKYSTNPHLNQKFSTYFNLLLKCRMQLVLTNITMLLLEQQTNMLLMTMHQFYTKLWNSINKIMLIAFRIKLKIYQDTAHILGSNALKQTQPISIVL